MASFTLTTNTQGFLSAQMKKRTDFMAKAIQLIQQDTLYFIALIQSTQMSFPRRGPVREDGTRMQSGDLKRGWFNEVVAPNQAIQARVWTRIPYAPYHENGGTFEVPEHERHMKSGKVVTVRAHSITFQKRLHIGEAWTQDFLPKMRDAINTAFAQTMGASA